MQTRAAAAFLLFCLPILVLGPRVMSGADAPAAAGDPSDEASLKQQDIRKLLELSGSGKLGVQVATQMIEQFRQTMPQVPAEFWTEFQKQIDPGQLIELIVPIYDKHFSHDDIRELIKFYQSPIGQKLVNELPQISQEGMAAGQKWGQELGERIAEQIKARGYTKGT